MDEKYRRLFELSDKDFKKAIANLSAEKLDYFTLLSLSEFDNDGYLEKARDLIFTFFFQELTSCPSTIFYLIRGSKDSNIKKRMTDHLYMAYTKDDLDLQELLVLKGSRDSDVATIAWDLLNRHFPEEWEKISSVEQVVAMF